MAHHQHAESPSLHQALVELNGWLRRAGYRFTTITPASHARVLNRADAPARDLRDVFGWGRAFTQDLLGEGPMERLRRGRLLEGEDPGAPSGTGLLRSRVRFSTLGAWLFSHSAYPTESADAVFFGPDTYRFVSLIEAELARRALRRGARILDVGCGSGAGGILAAANPAAADASLLLADINPAALVHASANAESACLHDVACLQGDLFEPAPGEFDLIVANPPYLVDRAARAYRHGGGALGTALSERIVEEGVPRLAPGGRLIVYTGAPIVDGSDPFQAAVERLLAPYGWPYSYRELDPDVFGEELGEPAYAQVERIAAVAAVIERPH